MAEVDDRVLDVLVIDDGRGVHEPSDAPGLGFGLLLIEACTDRCSIDTPREGGTTVWMSFSQAPHAARNPLMRSLTSPATGSPG